LRSHPTTGSGAKHRPTGYFVAAISAGSVRREGVSVTANKATTLAAAAIQKAFLKPLYAGMASAARTRGGRCDVPICVASAWAAGKADGAAVTTAMAT
jgi:hypothetical protein